MTTTSNKQPLPQSPLDLKEHQKDSLMTEAITLALKEDLGRGDITSEAIVPSDKFVTASVIFKQEGVLAGMEIFSRVFNQIDPLVKVEQLVEDGRIIDVIPTICARVSGPARSILTGERTALNFLQRLSGVATVTRICVELAAPANIAILDTRKTTPGLRVFEKYAVRQGGGVNHRFGLFDAILIKDNHVALAGSVAEAIGRARLKEPDLRIEVEAATLEQVEQALQNNVDAILLDNMSPDMIIEAVKLIGQKSFIEVSGGIRLSTISDYLIPGVNAISIGALTHSAPSIDISLDIEV